MATVREADCNAARASTYRVSSLCCCVCVRGGAAARAAEQKPGDLNGVVVNAKGAPVAGAQILWQAADGRIPHVLHSDAQGRFHIPQLRGGLYEVRASAGDAWSEWEHNVAVLPGGDERDAAAVVRSASACGRDWSS